MPALSSLHLDIENRVQSIRENRPDWLCSKGCDHCCHHLAEIPTLSAAEWHLLAQGLATLSPQQLQSISQRMAALAEQATRPFVCPLLDQASGACPVYAQRPVACRTYGFYVQRDLGLYCHDIESLVAKGELAEVVWGNHDSIDQRLRGLGESRPLTEWFTTWEQVSR
ncbi:MAG: YkgJ family cysteine cluster protein [Azonexus sp.]|nr:YkgJ family cysteine cluster protein [Azonexus sp.]